MDTPRLRLETGAAIDLGDGDGLAPLFSCEKGHSVPGCFLAPLDQARRRLHAAPWRANRATSRSSQGSSGTPRAERSF